MTAVQAPGTEFVTHQVVARVRLQDRPDPDRDEDPADRDRDGNQAPDTPLDEPRPPRIEDPPPQPVPKGPYTAFTHTEAQR
jgi:hypothetical protein